MHEQERVVADMKMHVFELLGQPVVADHVAANVCVCVCALKMNHLKGI